MQESRFVLSGGYQILNEKEEYSEFLKLLSGSENLPADDHLLLSTITLNNVKYNCVNSATNSNIRLFGAYNYTVYVPTNESIRKLINDGVLMVDTTYQFLASLFNNYLDYFNYIYNKWVLLLLIAAILELYSSHRISTELKKERK